jgi:3-oxoacyl-[acyl-carrier-protein] synthase I
MKLSLLASGMVTPVGYSAPSSCAAMRPALDGVCETRFQIEGEWVRGGVVRFDDNIHGAEKLLRMTQMSIDECTTELPPGDPGDCMLLVCLAERERPGRTGELVQLLTQKLQLSPRFQAKVTLLESGAAGPVEALEQANSAIRSRLARFCVVAGVDSYLHASTLRAFHSQRRLLTRHNSDGFIPGEAAASILVSELRTQVGTLQLLGAGWGRELALRGAGIPQRGDGLAAAYQQAMEQAAVGFDQLDYRMSDITGEHFTFKEASLALARTMRIRKIAFDLQHPTQCTGRIGAAGLPLMLGVALASAKKQYAPGPGLLLHVSCDDGRRAAVVAREHGNPSPLPLP